ncbi:hypothetical protein TNCV_5077241 [Trichonephila clavipes]|uniref:Uncharacterized protein n=1 Tax=Trichonephila clavipes TaxID=2585209 RepID=A0A8X6S1K3_TRICX|nr:hypothetical protein TNCV_5077241 [Trichonephila clavipes]
MRRFYEKRQAYVSPHTNVNIPHHFHANSPEAVDQAFTVSNLGFGITSKRIPAAIVHSDLIVWQPTSNVPFRSWMVLLGEDELEFTSLSTPIMLNRVKVWRSGWLVHAVNVLTFQKIVRQMVDGVVIHKNDFRVKHISEKLNIGL